MLSIVASMPLTYQNALFWLFIFAFFPSATARFDLADNCRVFCYGPLLEAVQRAHLFLDSKYFVDMPLVYDPNTTLTAFEKLVNKSDHQVLRDFVEKYFKKPGEELTTCHQTDWTRKPAAFDVIGDRRYRQWAYKINDKWRTLCRQMKQDVLLNPNQYSLIHVPYPFVAPGGRFREFYYWDTYWIIKGLLLSGMKKAAKEMILNLADTVRRYGFVPNGGRIYYLHRTQPPLFAGCVYEYFKATNDTEFIRKMMPYLEKEHEFWDRNRRVDLRAEDADANDEGDFRYALYQYRVKATGPRPESYMEDIETAAHIESDAGKRRIWSDIAAACESGWDFSSRWFTRNKSDKYRNNLRSVRTSRILPVDLNAFICWNDWMMAEMYQHLGNGTKADIYRSRYEYMRYAMHKVFWDERDGTWYDVDFDDQGGRRRRDYYVSNPTPLWAKCGHTDQDPNLHRRILDYLNRTGALMLAGGLPTSFVQSGEQWDSPNGWAPVNHIIIEALFQSNDSQVQEEAFQLASKWIESNYYSYARSGGKMFEKYDVENFKSRAGGGGEYQVQEGFGWTNGVILDLLVKFGDRLKAPEVPGLLIDDEPNDDDYDENNNSGNRTSEETQQDQAQHQQLHVHVSNTVSDAENIHAVSHWFIMITGFLYSTLFTALWNKL